MFLTESYRKRLQELAGITPKDEYILLEVDLYSNMKDRVKFNIDMMKQAIEQGREVGLVFQTKNERYASPIWKARIIQPVAMGYNEKGNLVIRAIHVTGQSEKEAQKRGIRSAEVNNQWRLFKASNIKSMFFSGRFFNKLSVSGYNPRDSAMSSILVTFDATKAKEYQDSLKTPAAPEEKQPEEMKPERLNSTPQDKLNAKKTPSLPSLPTLPSVSGLRKAV